MAFLATDARGEAARIRWLIRLRWLAVLGVVAVVSVAGPLFGMIQRSAEAFAVALALGAWNLALWLRQRRGLSLPGAGRQVAVDLAALGLLLAFTGGLANPFSIFVVVQVILGGILLPRGTAVRIGGLGALVTVGLALLELLGLLPDNEILRASLTGKLSVGAIDLALLITIGVALWFTVMVMEDLRERAREADRYHEEADRERRKVLEIVRSSGTAIAVLDAGLRTVWLNPRAAAILGDAEAGRPFTLPGTEGWPEQGALASGRVVEREWSGRDATGRHREYSLSAAPVTDTAGHLEQVILVFTDITHRRAAERQLYRTEKLAALGRLAAGVAHEINTPLASVRILGSEAEEALERASRGSGDAAAELREHLHDIRQETERIAVLVRRLLDLSHPGRDARQAVDLAALADDVVRLVSVRAPAARGRLRTRHETALPVTTSPDQLRQVLMNVVDNALDATEDNGGAVVVQTRTADGTAIVEVEDHGTGIAEEDLARVFEPFFTTKEVGEGTGLGLYVSYEIMKNLGGDIAVESRLGVGTVVRITLPRTAPVEPPPECP